MALPGTITIKDLKTVGEREIITLQRSVGKETALTLLSPSSKITFLSLFDSRMATDLVIIIKKKCKKGSRAWKKVHHYSSLNLLDRQIFYFLTVSYLSTAFPCRYREQHISPSQNKSLTVKLSIDRTHTVYSSICVIIFLLNFDHFCLILWQIVAIF